MKRLRSIAFCFLLACKSEQPKPTLIGEWEWVSSREGLAGWTIKAPESEHRQMKFDGNGVFTSMKNGKVMTSAKYLLQNAESISSTKPRPMIVFPNQDAINMSYTLHRDSLFLFEEVYDGYSHVYVRR